MEGSVAEGVAAGSVDGACGTGVSLSGSLSVLSPSSSLSADAGRGLRLKQRMIRHTPSPTSAKEAGTRTGQRA